MLPTPSHAQATTATIAPPLLAQERREVVLQSGVMRPVVQHHVCRDDKVRPFRKTAAGNHG